MDYLEVLDGMKEDMLHTLQDAIKIDSVLAPAVKGEDGQTYPFGAGIQKAYEHMLSVGEEMGFETANYDNYGGHIEFKAPDSEMVETFGITPLLDVVTEIMLRKCLSWELPLMRTSLLFRERWEFSSLI